MFSERVNQRGGGGGGVSVLARHFERIYLIMCILDFRGMDGQNPKSKVTYDFGLTRYRLETWPNTTS